MIKSQKGFALIEAILVLVIIGILGGVGWYIWDTQNKTNDTFNNANSANNSIGNSNIKTYIRTTIVPADWKTYTNKELKFSLAYPSDSNLFSENILQGKYKTYDPSSDAFDYRNLITDLSLKKKSEPMQGASYGFMWILNQPLVKSLNQFKDSISIRNASYPDDPVTLSTRQMLIDGHKMTIAESKSKNSDSIGRRYFIEAYNHTYIVDIFVMPEGLTPNQKVASNGVPENEALTIFESLKIQ